MSVHSEIEQALRDTFDPHHLEVINESGGHNVPPGSETHFKVVVVSEGFEGQPLVARHRAVNAALAAQLAGPVHALSIQAHTPAQWAERGGSVPASPRCRGGGQ